MPRFNISFCASSNTRFVAGKYFTGDFKLHPLVFETHYLRCYRTWNSLVLMPLFASQRDFMLWLLFWPGTDLRVANRRPRTIEKRVGESLSSELAQHRRAWSASVRDVVNEIGDAGSARPGWMPTQVQVSKIMRRVCAPYSNVHQKRFVCWMTDSFTG